MGTKALTLAGWMLLGIAGLQALFLFWFCWQGGIEGMVSPVAAVAVGWPVIALLGFVGMRLRQVPQCYDEEVGA